MIDLSHCVFLVDGQTEILAFHDKLFCEYNESPDFRKVGCNGKCVTPKGYANAAHGIIVALLRGSYRKIVCIADRERRKLTARNFAQQVRSTIIDKILSSTNYQEADISNKLIVCSPDTMFENWIIADVEGIKAFNDIVKNDAEQQDYDGTSGVRKLQMMLNVKYKKTLHAPKLFKKIIFTRARSNSPSFSAFCTCLDI